MRAKGIVQVGWQHVLGNEGCGGRADLDDSVAPGGPDELLDGPDCAVHDERDDGEGGEDDGRPRTANLLPTPRRPAYPVGD